ncbi:MAG: chemotaxis protein CheA [Oscillospiraceae bacterium]|jgi:two-component system chemotaxis sensor kinase CheA|nr:chemotaxis protein CheA [Oscillospiraceae bacterium]
MGRFEAGMESMVDTYIFEATGLLEDLDKILIDTEESKSFSDDNVNEIFRIMHTIKGSSAMMGLDNMATLAHHIEDLFFIIRDNPTVVGKNQMEQLFDICFTANDLLKTELDLIQDSESTATDFSEEISKIAQFIEVVKNGGSEIEVATVGTDVKQEINAVSAQGMFSIRVFFEDGCEMENLRALLVINQIKDDCKMLEFEPADIESNSETAKYISEKGFVIHFIPKDDTNEKAIFEVVENALNVRSYEMLDNPDMSAPIIVEKEQKEKAERPQIASVNLEKEEPVVEENSKESIEKQLATLNKTVEEKNVQSANAAKANAGKQSLISVNLNKLDQLLDMVGEIVIAEAMVTASPDLKRLKLDNFQKSARQLRKLTDELQDIVMSIRMVPLSGVFNKMTRIVRDMKVKLNKDVNLVLEGEETEVDKSIIDNLNDPIMHMVRNSMDHGIEENVEDRIKAGKPAKGTITLAAYNSSGEVIIVVADDGTGIDVQNVLRKAESQGILTKPASEYTDKEAFNLVMMPGFSTNEEVTEFSGRGVGMDVVRKNIEKIGGTVSVDSKWGCGTNFIIKIPLSLAIVDGIEVSVGPSIFTIPINSIKEFIKLKENQIFLDTSGKEMVKIRNQVFPLLRLHEYYGLEAKSTNALDGVVVVVESEGKSTCLLADELIGEQQVVVKPFSPMLNRYNVKQNGMAGCTILGDGSITIILDISNIIRDY